MTTNHPAHGPVSLDRLHQISEILSKAAAQSDGGNLGYAMADAVKVIDGAIASFGADPAAEIREDLGCLFVKIIHPSTLKAGDKLYATPPAPVVPDEYRHLSELYHSQEKRLFKLAQRIKGPSFDKYAHSPSQAIDVLEAAIFGDNEDTCRAAMLQAGNSPVTPDTWIAVSERMPEAHEPIYIFHPDYGVDEGVWYDNQEDAFLWDSDCSRCRAIETVSHWMPMPALPAAPKREVKNV
ncbi:DUF551 domain-containing protein [Citrobacter freundii]|uniref:DUF551 domain-containing protein n=1 Tax=Citrobacter TaxID=544 RepID=UPI002575F238|nr:DUF551 domain-containing protein [Citrobacter sp. Cf118]MDM3162156.1 DUF551 domain-containing protein [Citrobacter sp. Cf118]HBV2907701.1 DUF551 domain-containing protein [Citrobacter freundii]